MIIQHLAATERDADRRRAAAEHRRTQSALLTKAAAEQRVPALRATRQPWLRRLIRPA
jgi:hypothetical protein